MMLSLKAAGALRTSRLHRLPSHFRPSLLSSTKGRQFDASRLFSANAQWPVEDVRAKFVEYFEQKHQHVNYKSSPCVPLQDPTLLFANAGMNQFKPIFIGTVGPTSPLATLKRAVNSQKCIRAGGKHNDLEDVGKDTYHHTFFEMLGTWSFGDYFKKEAIVWAYDILVNTYKLDPNRMYASYFGGDETLGLPCDTEARDLWLQFLPPERVLPFDKKANFWEMGDTGPCGPCSEIHYDRIGGRDAAALVNADDPTVIEIWNLVFIQFNREPDGSLRSLPHKHIDTGMGLERLTSILQDKPSNYDTDVFEPLFKALQKNVGCAQGYTGLLGAEDAKQNYRDTAYRVVADHIRTLSFAITDGAVPSNEGRGYVLRRILRRAVRYGRQTLGASPGFLSDLVPVVVNHFGGAFPELKTKQSLVQAIIRDEELSFASLLDNGVKYFNEIAEKVRSQGATKVISGDQAFFLYDTLGFPIDLTQIMAAEQGLVVDVIGFQQAMDTQKQRSRVATQAKRLAGRNQLTFGAEQIAYLQQEARVDLTSDDAKYDVLTKSDHVSATVRALYTGDKQLPGGGFTTLLSASELTSGTSVVGIVLDRTNFYAEAGGQVADSGTIVLSRGNEQLVLDVLDVQSYGGYVLHTCALSTSSAYSEPGQEAQLEEMVKLLQVGATVTAQVDTQKRRHIAPNHSMTHVLNHALRDVLCGNPNSSAGEVDQRGSLVSSEKLRFDFSWTRPVTSDELRRVEDQVNAVIRANLRVYDEVVPLTQASRIPGLRAVFGEVYPDPVRVLSIGTPVDTLLNLASSTEKKGEIWAEHSVEFCGGTHLAQTGDAVAFAILEETAVAKGIRRISATTGILAQRILQHSNQVLADAVDLQRDVQQLSSAKQIDQMQLAQVEERLSRLRQMLDQGTQNSEDNVDSAVPVSQVVKTQVRSLLETTQRGLLQIYNAQRAARLQTLLVQVKAEAIDHQTRHEPAVFVLPVGEDSKALKKAVDEIQKAAPDLSFLVMTAPAADSSSSSTTTATDAEEHRIAVFAVVSNRDAQQASSSSSAATAALQADVWVARTIAQVVDAFQQSQKNDPSHNSNNDGQDNASPSPVEVRGKSGGRAQAAQGNVILRVLSRPSSPEKKEVGVLLEHLQVAARNYLQQQV